MKITRLFTLITLLLMYTTNTSISYLQLLFATCCLVLCSATVWGQDTIRGKVSAKELPLAGVSIINAHTQQRTLSEAGGRFAIQAESTDSLVFRYLGYQTLIISVGQRDFISVELQAATAGLNEVVVVGYGTQKKEDITSAISSISGDDLKNVNAGATISSKLAGKLSGLSFRQVEGRPGSGANIRIRNMGAPLYVVDGVIENAGRFNQLAPEDIASISVLKDASAASVYGVKAGNGVVVITTKKGRLNSPTRVNINAYTGWQNLTRYPNDVVDAYHWKRYAAEAQMNTNKKTTITPEEIQKWKEGTEYGYQSFDWADMIFQKNAPQSSLNINVSGGSPTTNYYFSFSRLKQSAAFDQYSYGRYNVQGNVDTRIGKKKRLKLGVHFNGKIEDRIQPAIKGGDKYWQPLFATIRNTPMDHPYANGNPDYLNDIGHNTTNAGYWNFDLAGKKRDRWWAMATKFSLHYDFPVKGLTATAFYNFTFEHRLLTNHEKTFDTYTYNPVDSTYIKKEGSANPYQERRRQQNLKVNFQGRLNYNRGFDLHHLGVMLATNWYSRDEINTHLHAVPPVNDLDIFLFNTIDDRGFEDIHNQKARIGYIGRITYDYAQKYYIELSGREDASWMFPPEHRWGFFPAASLGWRLTKEPFFQSLLGNSHFVNDLKIRASYGQLGSDNVGIGDFAYVPGYNYANGTFIKDGEAYNTARDRGIPVTNISWYKSHMANVGVDFYLWNGKISGSLEYFYRKRTGLLDHKSDVLIPNEVGYVLPQENLNSDAVYGEELNLNYTADIGRWHLEIYGNINYARQKFLHSYKPRWGNSWDHYRNSREERLNGLFWGYEVIGQFTSQEQINTYPVNVDGLGNTSLLPGDLIYKDVNGDGSINKYDQRPIGYNIGGQPSLYGGLGLSVSWNNFDLTTDFSFAGLYSFLRNWEVRWPFQNGGSLLKSYTDRWHRADPFDLNSEWIPGKNPPLRFNDKEHSNYNKNSTYWLFNVRYFRARTFALGYTLPKRWTDRVSMQQARLYISGYNLFSLDNMHQYASFLDPEIATNNGLRYPQSKFINVGINLTF